MAAGSGDKRSGDPIHLAFEGLVGDEPLRPPAPPDQPRRPPDDEEAGFEEFLSTLRKAAEEAAAASVESMAERFDRKLDAIAALLELQGPSGAADDHTRIDSLREELRSGMAAISQGLHSDLTRLSHGLARETAEIRGELEGLAVQMYQAGTASAGGAEATGDGLERLRAEIAAQRKQLRAEVDAAMSGLTDPRGDTWRGLRANLEVLLAGSTERLRAEVAHDQDEFRAEMRSALATVLDRHAKALADRLASLEAAVTAEATPRSGADDVRAALAAHARLVDERISGLEALLVDAGDRQVQDAASTRMELRAEVQAVLAAAMDHQAAAWDRVQAELERMREAAPAEPAAAAADSDEGLANLGERLREELEGHRRDLAAALEEQAGSYLRSVQAVVDAAVRAAVADAAEAQSRVLGERTAELAAAAAATSEQLRDDLAAVRSESATLVESALAGVIRQQGQAWEARRGELEAALADTFERVEAVIRDEREALEIVRSEVVSARLEDPQRIARLETAVADMSRRMAELSVATVEATTRQVGELRQVQNDIYENSRQLYAVLTEEGEKSAAEMRSLLRQAQRVMDDSRQEVRAEIADALLKASTDQERRFHVQAGELDEALARSAADHARQLDRQTAAFEAILHSFGQRLNEDRRAADLTAEAVAGDVTTAIGRLREEVHQRMNEVGAASNRASASADAALAEVRAAQEQAVGVDELREAVAFLRGELARYQRMVSARDRYALPAAESKAGKPRAAAKKAPARKRTAS